mmetsp:Transcript_37720/g.90248  ORF Transcript_37720/g.90248 Transcript_37720/m.90248 type:complete len:139 (-) Transcript_37720:2795-3211(-)
MVRLFNVVTLVAVVVVSSVVGSPARSLRTRPVRAGCPGTQLKCTRCSYGHDGQPVPERYCYSDGDACPDSVCCDIRTEKVCFDENGVAERCARIDSSDGCECPEGQRMCGKNQFSSGFCFPIDEECPISVKNDLASYD